MLLTGVVTAFLVALAFRLVPDDTPTTSTGGLVLFAVGLVSAPVFVVIVRWWGRLIGRFHDRNASIATIGALTFDSVATGFAPQLYGHQGAGSTTVLASIVFGGVAIVVADHLMTHRKEH